MANKFRRYLFTLLRILGDLQETPRLKVNTCLVDFEAVFWKAHERRFI